MAKRKLKLIIISISIGITGIVHAQTTIIGNTRPIFPPSYLGWDGTGPNPGSLDIRNNFAGQPMNFFTAGTQRMNILGTNGFVGIGNNFNAPSSLLHINGNTNATGEVFKTDGPSQALMHGDY